MIYIVNETNKPLGDYGGSVWSWKRALDPFHADAMPTEFKSSAHRGERKAGWMGLDYWGNEIVFVEDGTVEQQKGK